MFTVYARGVRGRKGDVVLRIYLPYPASQWVEEQFWKLFEEWLKAGGWDRRFRDVEEAKRKYRWWGRELELPVVVLPRGFQPKEGETYLVDVVKVTKKYLVARPHEHRWVERIRFSDVTRTLLGVEEGRLVVRTVEGESIYYVCEVCGAERKEERIVRESVVRGYPHELLERGIEWFGVEREELESVARLVVAGLSRSGPRAVYRSEEERRRLYELLEQWVSRFLKPRLVAYGEAPPGQPEGVFRVVVYTEEGEEIPVDVHADYYSEEVAVKPHAKGAKAVYAAMLAYAGVTGVSDIVEFEQEDEFVKALREAGLSELDRLMARLTEYALREEGAVYRARLEAEYDVVKRHRAVTAAGEEVQRERSKFEIVLPFRPGVIEIVYGYREPRYARLERRPTAAVRVLGVERVAVESREKIEMLRGLYESIRRGKVELRGAAGAPMVIWRRTLGAGRVYLEVDRSWKREIRDTAEMWFVHEPPSSEEIVLEIETRVKPATSPEESLRVKVEQRGESGKKEALPA